MSSDKLVLINSWLEFLDSIDMTHLKPITSRIFQRYPDLIQYVSVSDPVSSGFKLIFKNKSKKLEILVVDRDINWDFKDNTRTKSGTCSRSSMFESLDKYFASLIK
jgi:hypothetical protein